MKLAYISTYPPRQCGIGTFTQNLAHSMINNSEDVDDIMILAMNDCDKRMEYPSEVKFLIDKEHQTGYIEAADYINFSGADACILEHEFGIFGGDSGVYILPLLHRLEVPVITTLHTILKSPSYNEKAVLKEICKMSAKLVVMSHKAVEFLTEIYEVPREKIEIIDHGVPDLHFDRAYCRKKFKFEDKKVLMTFGFVGRNKGIETAIKALPEVIKRHPNVLYVVLGKTHPNVLRHAGEEYRNYLQKLIKKLDLADHVLLLNQFVEEKELFQYLAASDVYITPYLNEAQITSGTLTYAMGSGCAVVSTPYWHAAELLSNDRGKLFNFGDIDGLSGLLSDLFDNPDELRLIQERARTYGKNIIWPKIGKRYAAVVKDILSTPKIKGKKGENIIDLHLLPPFSLAHIKRLTDDTGIIQHAKFGIPNLKEGYCLDDNSRALLMVSMAYKQKKHPKTLELMPIYLSYIDYMQNPDGSFRNFLSFNRNYLDEVGSEDAFGRTIWALGYLISNPPNDAYLQTARLIFLNAVPQFEKLTSIRGIANTIIGICHYLKSNAGDENMKGILKNLTATLVKHYGDNCEDDWNWFESILSYDNGILPLALLHSIQELPNSRAKKVAFESMEFLTEHTIKEEGYLSIIGNRDWFVKGKERAIFAQQPIDATAMVLMYNEAYRISKSEDYLTKMFISFMWFLGENDMRMSLFDFETKGCCDGFEDYGVNRNQGAESSLAYYISFLTVLEAYEKAFHFEKSGAQQKIKNKRMPAPVKRRNSLNHSGTKVTV